MYFGSISRAGPTLLFFLFMALACFAVINTSAANASEAAVSAQAEVATAATESLPALVARINLSFESVADLGECLCTSGAPIVDQSFELYALDEVARIEKRMPFVPNRIPEVSRGRCQMLGQDNHLLGYYDSAMPRATGSGRFAGDVEG